MPNSGLRSYDLCTKIHNSSACFSAEPLKDANEIADAFARSEFLPPIRALRSAQASAAVSSDPSYRSLLKYDYTLVDHDSSVCGPAAYAFDLMRIILTSVVTNDFKYRRPDLLDIPLDASNSGSKVIPAIDIVNYILERQLLKGCDSQLLCDDENGLRPSYDELMKRYDVAVFDLIAAPSLNTQSSIQTTSFTISPFLPDIVVQADVFHPNFCLYFTTQYECLKAMNSSLFAVYEAVVQLSTNKNISYLDKNISYLAFSSGEREKLTKPTLGEAYSVFLIR